MLVGTASLLLSPQAQATDKVFIYTGATDTITAAGNALVEQEDGSWTITDIREGGASWAGWFVAGNGATNATMNNVIRFTSADNYLALSGEAIGATKATTFDANNVCLGGITVDVGATGYSFSGKSTTAERYFNLYGEDSTDAESHAAFDINEDFIFNVNGNNSGRSKNINLLADADIDVAAEKTFTVIGNFNGTADRTLYLLGGGTMNYTHSASGSYNAGAMNWDLSGSSTLNMQGDGVNLTNALGTGVMTFNSGTLAIEAANKTLTNNILVGAGGGTISGTSLTLNGSISYAADSGNLKLNGSFTLGADIEFDLGVVGEVENGEYVLFTRESDATTVDFALSNITIANIGDPLRISSLEWVDNELRLTVADVTGKTVSIASGNLVWDLDAGTDPWTSEGAAASFNDGDLVIIGEGSDLGGEITIATDVSPRTVTVTGEGDWTLSGSGSIVAGSLTKEGTGLLTITTSNSYAGDTILAGGSLHLAANNAAGSSTIRMTGADTLLSMTDAAALGAANIIYTAGTIQYGAGMTDSLHDKISYESAATNFTLDVNGNDITWGAAIATDFTLQNSGADATFSYAHNFVDQTVTIAANVTLLSTTSSNAAGLALAGAGTLFINNTANYVVHETAGFTGTVNASNGAQIVTFNRHNTEADRFMLHTAATEAGATAQQAIVLGGAGWNSNQTLHLSGLSGYSNISSSNNVNVMNRGLNILMSADNTYHGDFHEANGGGDTRFGTVTIGGAYTFTWTGISTNGTGASSIGTNAKLLIKGGTTMNLATNDAATSGGQWTDDITIESGGKLLISRTDNQGFVQLATGNEITGEGAVEVTGMAVLQGANTYSGGTTVSGALTLQTAAAHGTGSLSITSAGSVTASAGFTQAAGQVVNNVGTLTLGGTLSLNSAITNSGNVVFNADTVFDLSALTGVEAGGVTTYTLFNNTGMLDFSALTATGELNLSSITGVTTEGLLWTLNNDGTITSAIDANTLIYSAGGNLILGVDATGFNGGAVFANGNAITFTTMDTQLNLAESVSVDDIRVIGIELDYTGGSYFMATSSISLVDGASFIMNDATISEETNFLGELGTSFIVNIGDGNSITRNDQLEGLLGDVIVRSGTLVIDNDASAKRMGMNSIIVEAGAALSTIAATFEAAADIPLFLQGSENDATQQATWNTGNVTFAGAITSTGYAAINVSDVLYLSTQLQSDGNLTFNTSNEAVVQLLGGLAGSGIVRVTGDGSFDLSTATGATHTHTGELHIDGGTLYLGTANGYDRLVNVQFDKIVMGSGTTLRLGMDNLSVLDSVNLELQGTTVNHTNFGDGDDNDIAMKSLILEGNNTFNLALKAGYTFGTLTGTGNMTITGAATANNAYNINFGQIENFSGTFTGVDNELFNLNVTSAIQQEGITGTIAGTDVNSVNFIKEGLGKLIIEQDLNASRSVLITDGDLTVQGNLSTINFAKKGTGTAIINSLTLIDGGSLQMTYAGSLEITDYSLTGSLRLNYLKEYANVLNIADTELTGVTGIIVSVLGYSLEDLQAGIALGISKDYADGDLTKIQVLGLDDGQYNIVADGEYYKLTATSLVDVGWDANWGEAVLATRPITVPEVADLANEITHLYDAATADPFYTDGAVTRVELTDGGGAAAQVIGIKTYGSNDGAEAIVTDVWIKATGGEFLLLAGGSVVNNWQNTNTMELRGDTHIEVDGAAVGHIVGGNLREGGHALMTGDSYISVFTNTVTGSIIGAGSSRHADGSISSRRTTFTGNTNIYVYTPLTVSDASSPGGEVLTNDSIIGGHHWGDGTVGFAFNGNTNVTIDLSSYTDGEATMVKSIIGGGRVGDSSVYTHVGDTYVTIKGHTDVTFNDWVMGATTHINSATSSHSGNTNVSISGDSTFSARVTAAANHVAGTGAISGETILDISGGSFNELVMAGYNQHAGATTIGGSKVTISGGTFNANVAGGGVLSAGSMTNTGDVSMNITAGSFTQNVYAGTLDLNAASVNTVEGNVNMSITGGTIAGVVAGGSRISGNHWGSADIVGDVDISLDGSATISGDIIGGHHVSGSSTGSTLSAGNIAIKLLGGTVNGDVYAAGFLAATQTVASEVQSTSISMSSAVTLSASGNTISGGFGGAGASSGQVLADRVLSFTDAGEYMNLANASFTGFNIVDVSEATGIVSISHAMEDLADVVEKRGAGTLQIAAVNHASALTISEGTLRLASNSQANSITSINVARGATLDMSAASTGINGALTLNGGSSLLMTAGVAGSQIGASGSLALVGATTSKITLTGLSIAAGVDLTETLFTGLTASTITGITWDAELLSNGMQGVLATSYFASDQDLSGFYLAFDADNGELILTNEINANLVWAGGDGEWTAVDIWEKASDLTQNETFEDNDNVSFNTGTGDVTIASNVEAKNVLLTGTGVDYSFSGAGVLTVSDTLSVLDGAAASFTGVDLSSAGVIVAENSMLSITDDVVMANLDNSGAVTVGTVGDATTHSLTISAATSKGGALTVTGDLTLVEDNTFSSLNVGGDVLGVEALTLTDDSRIEGAFAGSSLSTSGDTTYIGSVTNSQASLTNGTGTLEIGSALSVTGDLSNEGTLDVDGALTLSQATTEGGSVIADSVSLTGDNIFNSIESTGEVAGSGSLQLEGISEVGSLSGITDLILSETATLEVTSSAETNLNSLSGGGSLSLNGALTLAQSSSAKNLTIGDTLTLGGVLNLSGVFESSSTLNVNLNYELNKAQSAITVGNGVLGMENIKFNISDVNIAALNLTSSEEYILMSGLNHTLTSVLLNNVDEYESGSYSYTISQEGSDIKLLATLQGNSWTSTTTAWSEGSNWSGGTSPSSAKEAIFSGEGTSSVSLSSDAAASYIIVDIADGATTSEYTLSSTSDATLTTGRINVNKGSLTLDLATSVEVQTPEPDPLNPTGKITVGSAGILNIGENGVISTQTLEMAETAALTIAEGGELTVAGALMGSSVHVNNMGTLSLGANSAVESVSGTGSLTVTGDATIESITAANFNLMGTSELSSQSITVSTGMTGTGDISTQNLTLGSSGNTMGSLSVETMSLGGEFQAGVAQLQVDEITSASGAAIQLDMLGFDATTAVGSYTIIGKLTSSGVDHSWDSFELSDDDKVSFNDQRLSGKDVVLTEENGELKLAITKADGRIWDTANSFAVTPGLESVLPTMKVDVIDATGGIASYAAMDTVQGIIVTSDVKVDLRGLLLEPSDTRGLLIRNLGGMTGKTMDIIGNGVDDSLVTLLNSKDTFAQNTLSIRDTKLQVTGVNDTAAELENLQTDAVDILVRSGASLEVVTGEMLDTELTVHSGGSFILKDSLTMNNSSITVQSAGSAVMKDVNLLGSSSLVEQAGGSVTVESLSGGVDSKVDGEIHVVGTGGKFEGSYVTNTVILLEQNSQQELTVDENLSVIGQEGSKLTLKLNPDEDRTTLKQLSTVATDVTLAGNTATTPLVLSTDSSMTEGSLKVSLDADNMKNVLNGVAGSSVQQLMTSGSTGGSLTLTGVDILVSALSGGEDTGVLDLSGITSSDNIVIGILHDSMVNNGSTISLDGVTMNKYFKNIELLADGSIIVDLNRDGYSSLAQTENGAAGLGMVGDAIISLNAKLTGTSPEYKDLAAVVKSMDSYLNSGNASAADKLGAAVAGSSVTALGSSMLSSVEQQLQSVRNRTTTMGGNSFVAAEGPIYSAWISAEGGRSTLDHDATASGHDYNTWGGSLGFYSDVAENFTIGMSLSALSGTLSSDVADIASGDLNTYGVSAYAVVLDDRWSHTFIASASIADATLNRTVSHANGSYTAEGSTDGYGLGLMYEVGYTYGIGDEGSTSWQPIFNVAIVHGKMNGYEETASDAALLVGDQSSTYASFGLGGRIETTVGENAFNRSAILSARALMKLDVGDRYTSADVALIKDAAIAEGVTGAQPGAFGIELGAGLNIPVGIETGSIFMDAGLELRSGMNSVSGSVGYQLEF